MNMKTSNHNRNPKDVESSLALVDVTFSLVIIVIAGLSMALLYTVDVWSRSLQGQELLKSWGIGSKSIFYAVILLETVIPAIVAVPVTYCISKKSRLRATASTVMISSIILLTEPALSLLDIEKAVKYMILCPLLGWGIGTLVARVIILLASRIRVSSKPT